MGKITEQELSQHLIDLVNSKVDINHIHSTYIHNQIAPLEVWTIAHNLGKYPNVVIVDSGGTQVLGDVRYISSNTIEISFTSGFSGTAYLN